MEYHMVKKRPALCLTSAMDLPVDLTPQLVSLIQALPSSVKADYLKAQIQAKYVSPETASADLRRSRAIEKWLSVERDNEVTNQRLLDTHEEYNILPRVTFGDFTEFCRDLVCDIIGETPPISALIGRFSGGASTSRQRTYSHPASKYLGEAHVTPRCLDIFALVEDEMPGWLGAKGTTLRVVPGNVLFTVPKKTEIDRCACKEPDINMFLQKGIGRHFRMALRSHGVNLNDQSVNNRLAREGSVTGSLATLDLSSASDSVTYELVAQLLPLTWFTLLDSTRCQVTVIDGEEHRNEMFSSMGNGFTFELESLLFYVLGRAVAYFTRTPGKISVYGDDIICPTGMSHDLIWVLKYFGFSTNIEKSFTEGPFRESCGGHFHNGSDITPFYIKKPVDTLIDLIHVANQLRKWAYVEDLAILDPDVYPIWSWLKNQVPDVLWGGVDTAFKYQLVSPDVPSYRIREDTKKKSNGAGGYYHWLNATWDRTGLTHHQTLWANDFLLTTSRGSEPEAVSTSSRTVGAKQFRLRPVLSDTVPRLPALFLEELS
jgi:hypothetical protein